MLSESINRAKQSSLKTIFTNKVKKRVYSRKYATKNEVLFGQNSINISKHDLLNSSNRSKFKNSCIRDSLASLERKQKQSPNSRKIGLSRTFLSKNKNKKTSKGKKQKKSNYQNLEIQDFKPHKNVNTPPPLDLESIRIDNARNIETLYSEEDPAPYKYTYATNENPTTTDQNIDNPSTLRNRLSRCNVTPLKLKPTKCQQLTSSHSPLNSFFNKKKKHKKQKIDENQLKLDQQAIEIEMLEKRLEEKENQIFNNSQENLNLKNEVEMLTQIFHSYENSI